MSRQWTLKYHDWLRAARIALAASDDEERPILGCLQLTVPSSGLRRGKLVAAATDGHILAVNAVDLDGDSGAGDWEICIPAAEVAAVTKLVTTEIKRDVPKELRSLQSVHLVASDDAEGEPALRLQYIHRTLVDVVINPLRPVAPSFPYVRL